MHESKITETIAILKKMASAWEYRAQIKKSQLPNEILFDVNADDFLADLLPFKNHPIFLKAPELVKKKIYTCGWIIYNHKTLAIEMDVINRAGQLLLADKIPGVSDFNIKKAMIETMIDEYYHVLLVVNALEVTHKFRRININVPPCHLTMQMNQLINIQTEDWQKNIIVLITAFISEMLISDYLSLLSSSTTIQPINQLTVQVHREDELAHANIFKQLMTCIYEKLNPIEKSFFSHHFLTPIAWFANQELDIWQSVLKQIDFADGKNMINDCKKLSGGALARINYEDILLFGKGIGIHKPLTDLPICF